MCEKVPTRSVHEAGKYTQPSEAHVQIYERIETKLVACQFEFGGTLGEIGEI